jgi:galactokinase
VPPSATTGSATQAGRPTIRVVPDPTSLRPDRLRSALASLRPDPTSLRPDRLRSALAGAYPDAVATGRAVRVVRAPGRVNLIGEHTDYNDGLVLPVAIDLEIRLALAPTDDGEVRLTRLDDGDEARFGLDDPPAPSGAWSDYVAGVAWSMREGGLPRRGLRGVLASTLPIGAGLSSSAAL